MVWATRYMIIAEIAAAICGVGSADAIGCFIAIVWRDSVESVNDGRKTIGFLFVYQSRARSEIGQLIGILG